MQYYININIWIGNGLKKPNKPFFDGDSFSVRSQSLFHGVGESSRSDPIGWSFHEKTCQVLTFCINDAFLPAVHVSAGETQRGMVSGAREPADWEILKCSAECKKKREKIMKYRISIKIYKMDKGKDSLWKSSCNIGWLKKDWKYSLLFVFIFIEPKCAKQTGIALINSTSKAICKKSSLWNKHRTNLSKINRDTCFKERKYNNTK